MPNAKEHFDLAPLISRIENFYDVQRAITGPSGPFDPYAVSVIAEPGKSSWMLQDVRIGSSTWLVEASELSDVFNLIRDRFPNANPSAAVFEHEDASGVPVARGDSVDVGTGYLEVRIDERS